jgi:hypothetical protein
VALDTPLAVLVAIHAGRVLGVFFLLLLAAGRLPPTFAMVAGWGDLSEKFDSKNRSVHAAAIGDHRSSEQPTGPPRSAS